MWEVKGVKKMEAKIGCEGITKQQYPTLTCACCAKALRELYNEGGAMSPQNGAKAPSPIWSSHYFVFGTSLLSVCRDEGGNGIGFFEPQGM